MTIVVVVKIISPATQAGAVHDTTEKNMVDNYPPPFSAAL